MFKDYRFLNRILYFLSLIAIGLSIGTLGYMIIEGWSFLDSLYMSVITTSTVGFMEVNPMSDNGRIFTMFLIFLSFGTFAYAITSISKFIAAGEYRLFLAEFRLGKRLSQMKNHVIICGYGRVGKQVAEDLLSQNIPVTIIEQDVELIERVGSIASKNIVLLEGDAGEDETIERAKIGDARALITCLPKDSDNLYVVLTAKELRKDIFIISRAASHQAVSKLKRAGANHVIMPGVIGGSHMASLVSSPDVMEFMESIKAQGKEVVNIESIAFNELPPEFRNKTIRQLDSERLSGVAIIGYKDPQGNYLINPDPETTVVENSKLFVLGTPHQISNFTKIFHLRH
ncbi:MAG: potassium channel protein [Bacteroidetes bacterium]|nr:MAG: potassium channel protein [Bacteroidota bacterium]